MFPNVRLLILALFASIVALSCGFGVFAAFRVNHEPLSRLPADTAPLQLVADEPAPPPASWGAPFGSRLRLSEAQIDGATVDAPALTPVRRDAIKPPNLRTVGTAKLETTTGAPQRQASQPTEPSAATAPHAPAAPPAPTPTTPPPTAPLATTMSTPATQTPHVETQAVQSAPDVVEDAAGKTAAEPAKAAIPAVAAIEPAAKPAPPVAPPVEITGSAPETAPPEARVPEKLIRKARPRTLRKTAREPIERRRIAVRKRLTRKEPAAAVAQFGGQNSTFHEPVFQSAPNVQRKTEKRPRTARKTAKNTAPSNPFAWPNAQ